jgi:hypothetical protein
MGVLSRVAVCAAALLFHAVAAGAGEAPPQSERTWRRISELSAPEREAIDLRAETPRDAEIPYLPAEPYPFEPPFTAEEMGYRLLHFSHNARWPHVWSDSVGSLTSAGYLAQSTTVTRASPETQAPGVPGHMHTAPGKPVLRLGYFFTYPPRRDGMHFVWTLRRTDKEHRTKLDEFAYSPSMRRVRRQPQQRRDEPLLYNVQNLDDVTGRDPWEFTWRVIGADVLRQTVRFPVTRPTMTLAHGDGSFYDVRTGDIRIMGDTFPFYTADGGVECLVLVAEPRESWLPDYAASKLVYWIDAHYFFPLRIEQYDVQGRLDTVQVRLARQENPALGPEGYTGTLTVYWDLELDLTSYNLHDAHKLVEWSEDERAILFSPDFMRRRWPKYWQPTQARVASPQQFYLRPSLERGKFPEERRLELAPDLAARIRAQDAAGHRVFDVPGG